MSEIKTVLTEVNTVPHVPLSHPFVERLIGTVRRELLDHVPFWGAADLARKLAQFKDYYNDDSSFTHHWMVARQSAAALLRLAM
jgi:hypothetical protein